VRALTGRHPGWELAQADSCPFTLPTRRLADSRVCLVSFAGVYLKGQKPFSTSPGLIPAELRKMRFRDRGDWSLREIPRTCDPGDLAVAHAHYNHSDADEDINCVFPLTRLIELELDGFIGECAELHYSMMGYVPETRLIVETGMRRLIPALKKADVHAVIVSGGCELSHQSAGLIQREIEAAGICTVAVSVCADVSEQLRVPRAVALRFPLGNPFGASLDNATQARILRDALQMLEASSAPGEVAHLPYDWNRT
jgi:D-proline reductase (dithiol) PrdB